jgi:NAD(P)-dependent dehydrogenase (short-subunit alcohol dehydrogenase family)
VVRARHNACGAAPGKLINSTDGDWITGLELNLISAVRFTPAALPAKHDRRWGRIMNVSPTAARLADSDFPIYRAATAALVNFLRTVATAHASDGVRCSCVLPGITRAELIEESLGGASASPAALTDGTVARWRIPVARPGETREIADAIAFVASAKADWITGGGRGGRRRQSAGRGLT